MSSQLIRRATDGVLVLSGMLLVGCGGGGSEPTDATEVATRVAPRPRSQSTQLQSEDMAIDFLA